MKYSHCTLEFRVRLIPCFLLSQDDRRLRAEKGDEMGSSVISQEINGDFKTQGGQGLDTHNKEAIVRRAKRGKSILLSETQNAPSNHTSYPVGLHSAAGPRSSLRKHPRHLHIPPGAGKAAAALKLQPSSYWHEKENREGTGERRGGDKRERKRRR